MVSFKYPSFLLLYETKIPGLTIIRLFVYVYYLFIYLFWRSLGILFCFLSFNHDEFLAPWDILITILFQVSLECLQLNFIQVLHSKVFCTEFGMSMLLSIFPFWWMWGFHFSISLLVVDIYPYLFVFSILSMFLKNLYLMTCLDFFS